MHRVCFGSMPSCWLAGTGAEFFTVHCIANVYQSCTDRIQ